MKFISGLLSLSVVGVFVYLLFTYKLPTQCDQIIHYSLGTIDSRFNLTREELLTDIKQATGVWDSIVGKNLFVYDPNADLKVYLVYDERQSLSSQVKDSSETAMKDKGSLDSQIADYKNRAADFDRRLRELNSKIEYWNSQGGAPQEEYDKIKAEQSALTREADDLNALAARLNITVEDYNAKVNQLNQTENALESVLQTKPEAGLYDPKNNRIDIYFNTSRNELIHTLEHEFGHALGLDHEPSSNSIMYAKSSQIIVPSEEDKSQLLHLCQSLTPIEYLQSFKLAKSL